MTDDNGVFTFRRLREGAYFITVETGKEFLPAQETVDLFDNRPSTTTVQIELRLRTTAIAKASVVDAKLAGVPTAAVELYRKGMAAVANGDAKKAIEYLKGAVSIHPEFVLALNELSAVYINLGQLEKAEEALITALKYETNNAILRLNYGYVLLLGGRFAESEPELRRAIQLKDSSAMAHSYLGVLLIKLDRLDEAEKELIRAIALGGSSGVTGYRYLGALYKQKGNSAKAIQELETYLRLAPNARDAEQVRGIIKELQQQPSGSNTDAASKPPV